MLGGMKCVKVNNFESFGLEEDAKKVFYTPLTNFR